MIVIKATPYGVCFLFGKSYPCGKGTAVALAEVQSALAGHKSDYQTFPRPGTTVLQIFLLLEKKKKSLSDS